MQAAKPTDPPAPRRWWPTLLIVALIAGFIAVAVSLLPRGYSQDFSLIGKGGNVLVLVHDHNVVQSMDAMNAMNDVREEYEGRVTFLVADKYTPEGTKFIETYGVSPVSLVFFAPSGEKLQALYSPQDAASLRKNLNLAFHFQGAALP